MGRTARFLQDSYLLVGVIISFLLLLLVKIKVPVDPKDADVWIVKILSSEAFDSVATSILTSIVAAYIFYIFIEIIPRKKSLAETSFALDNILAAVVSSYVHNTGGHRHANVDRQNLSVLDVPSLQKLVAEVNNQGDFERLLSVLLHVREDRFILEQGTMLASSCSSRHAMTWIQICAYARDLANMFELMPRNDKFVFSDIYNPTDNEYLDDEGLLGFRLQVLHYHDRIRNRCWLLFKEILYWKINYPSMKP